MKFLTPRPRPALHHKILANHFGRLGDQLADTRDAEPDFKKWAEYDRQAINAYNHEHYHLCRRQDLGGYPGGRQPSANLARSYAQKA